MSLDLYDRVLPAYFWGFSVYSQVQSTPVPTQTLGLQFFLKNKKTRNMHTGTPGPYASSMYDVVSVRAPDGSTHLFGEVPDRR